LSATTGLTVSGNALASWISKYSLFGDIFTNKIGVTINTNTGIFLTTEYGIKHIITQIYSGADFATHFQKDVLLSLCGNGIDTDPGEQCDDGNQINTDECTNSCMLPICGDWYIWAGNEACDDSGTVNYDGCSASCATEATGTIACSNGDFNLGSITWGTIEKTLSGLADSWFRCVDMSGTTNGIYQVQMWNNLTNGITTIGSGKISILSGTVTNDCAGGVTSLGGALSGIINLMTKWTLASRCTFGFTPTLSVTIPSRASIGTYTGTIVITYPH